MGKYICEDCGAVLGEYGYEYARKNPRGRDVEEEQLLDAHRDAHPECARAFEVRMSRAFKRDQGR